MTFRPHHDPAHLYFVTATILGWKHLFIDSAYAEIALQSLNWHRRHGRWSLFAFVVMPNHMHFIVRPLGGQTISRVLQSFGSYTAHAILDRLRQDGRADLLAFFAQRQDHLVVDDRVVRARVVPALDEPGYRCRTVRVGGFAGVDHDRPRRLRTARLPELRPARRMLN